jgi:hypothetical protein
MPPRPPYATATDSASGSKIEEKKIAVAKEKPFCSDPRNVVALWNDLAAQCGLKVTLDWILDKETKDSTENYNKMLQGKYRDRNVDGLDALTRRNIEAAERALANRGIPPKARTAIIEGIKDGCTVVTDYYSPPDQAGVGVWSDAEYTEDRDLRGGPVGICGRAGDDGDRLGEE